MRNLRNISDKHIAAYVEHRRQAGRTEKVLKNHSYAREEYLKRIERGVPELKAQKEVALLLGHGRSRVVRIYLGSAEK